MADESQKSEWVSLAEAAEMLGVHPATVRNWADKGDLPSRRTAGGHRRFRRADLEKWLSARQGPPPAEVQALIQNAMGRMRLHISEGAMHALDWYEDMDEAARREMALKGRRMLEALQEYLVAAFDEAEAEPDVTGIGEDYGRFLVAQGLTIRQAMEGFIVFSDFLHEAALGLIELINVRPAAEWLVLLRAVRHFNNDLMVGLARVYERAEEERGA
ncbi:MAG: helix-turn-helix domain-containing protein [Anaerolineae bacterium]